MRGTASSAVDVGAYGKQSDGGIFSQSEMNAQLSRGNFHMPPEATLPGSDEVVPHIIVADEAFPLKPYMLRPFPGKNLSRKSRIFNYRLSRARRIVENAFGILASRWRIFHRRINASAEQVCFDFSSFTIYRVFRNDSQWSLFLKVKIWEALKREERLKRGGRSIHIFTTGRNYMLSQKRCRKANVTKHQIVRVRSQITASKSVYSVSAKICGFRKITALSQLVPRAIISRCIILERHWGGAQTNRTFITERAVYSGSPLKYFFDVSISTVKYLTFI